MAKIGYRASGWDEGFEINGENGRIVLETPVWNDPLRNAARLRFYDNATGSWTEFQTEIVCPFAEAQRYFLGQIEKGVQEAWFDRLVGYRTDLLPEKTGEAAKKGVEVKIR